MPVETFTYISSLVASNPPSSDGLAQADDHIRGIKSVLKNTFPNIDNAVNASDEELNQLNTKTFTGDGWTFQGDVVLQSDTTVARLTATEYLKGPGSCPTGMIGMFISGFNPPGWLLCNGQAVSRTTYADLFALIGTTYGAGDGSTTFNVPNMVERYPRCSGNTLAPGTLQDDQIGSHNHTGTTGSAGSHSHTGVTNPAGSHSHTYSQFALALIADAGGNQFGPQSTVGNPTSTVGDHQHSFATSTDGAHTHTFTTNNTGGSETRPKTFVVAMYIKT